MEEKENEVYNNAMAAPPLSRASNSPYPSLVPRPVRAIQVTRGEFPDKLDR